MKANRNRPPRVLVADDNPEMARMLCDALAERYQAVAATSGTEALDLVASESFDAVVTDLRMPDADGLAVLAASRRAAPERPVIVMTAFSAIDTAVESIRQGAYHYLTKPFKVDELVIFLGRAIEEVRLRREARALRNAMRKDLSPAGVLGRSKAMQAVLHVVERVADSPVPVLITGETGTGKGLLARAIHTESRRAGPFVTVNCAALPESLLESELFGHVRGAFTGATSNRPGLFLEANGGTLFLDEVGEMALPLQAKLLHALDASAVRPVGAEKEQPVDARIVAASNRDLREAVRSGAFREDLLYRLDVVTLEVPPLRHRRDDILELAEHFLSEARSRHASSPVMRLSPEAAEKLSSYSWPGNVRELQHVMERAVVLGRDAEVRPSELPSSILEDATRSAELSFRGDVIPVRELQRRYAAWALAQLDGQRGVTAQRLGVDGKTLAKWLAEPEVARSD
ncbi:MAG TPA: sigma-54 dependent transcriptional regulator [Anaeromyxobacteraceae bacterium]|nr:sigma-54 dependent transcriptional regulator [Anaeromyxobacteraceae bacterium]